ncbi:plasma membrane calcium, partial [Cryomyces antarcticus]
MSVVAGTLGTTSRFGDRKATAPDPTDPKAQQDAAIDVDDVSTTEFINTLAEDVKILWKDSIAINSTAFEGEEDGKQTFIGSKTETALLSFGRDHLGMGPVSVERSNAQLIQMIPFDSGRKCMGVVVQLQNGTYRLLVKGASEIMLGHCTKIIRDPTKAVTEASMSGDNNKSLNQIIDTYATRSLRTIGLLYRDFEQWPPAGARTQPDDPQQAEFSDVLKDMTFLGV